MTRLLKYFTYLLFLPLWWVQYLAPRKKNIWVFGAWYGNRFADNSRYLYQYVRENHPEIKAIWLTRDKNIRDKIIQKGGLAYLTNDLKGIYYSLRAKYVFVSSGKKDVNYLFIKGAIWIQLWHGSPLKRIGLDDRYSNADSFFQKNIVAWVFPFAYEYNYHYTISTAPIFSDKMASSFNLPLNKVLETGYPRNDVFFSKGQDPFNLAIRNKFKGCKLIYYMPTFRGYTGAKSLFTLEDYSQNELESFLEEQNIVLVSKGHYVDKKLTKENEESSGRLIDLKDEEVDEINFMLKDADLLITDYSSAYFDFLLTERPIVFAAFDLEEYLSASREMYFNYQDVIAGPIVKNWEELYSSLVDVWNNDSCSMLVREKNEIFNKHHDPNNSKRTFHEVVKL